jgi:hypothetical protein
MVSLLSVEGGRRAGGPPATLIGISRFERLLIHEPADAIRFGEG